MPTINRKNLNQKGKKTSLIAAPPHQLANPSQKDLTSSTAENLQTPNHKISQDTKPQEKSDNQEGNNNTTTQDSPTPQESTIKHDQPGVLISKDHRASNSNQEVKNSNIHEKEKIDSPKKPSLKKIIVLLTVLIIFIGLMAFVGLTLFSNSQEFLSPVPDNSKVLSLTLPKSTKINQVIGFLPFWNMKEEENLKYHLLTQVAFFSLTIDEQGNIKKLQDDNTEEPGWTAYKSEKFGSIYRKAKNSGADVTLTIQAMDPETIEGIVDNPLNRKKTIEQTLEIVNLKNLDGVNIDFEYAGAPSYQTTKNFTQFVKEFRNSLNQSNPDLLLSVDVFADSATKVRLWDIKQLESLVDYIIIMAYDFHRPSSRIAAPVAPIRGSPKLWEYDIIKTMSDFSKIISLQKIVLGIPYYGYEWRTTSEDKYSTTYPNTGSLATFKRVQSLIEEKNPNLDWDETALAPRLIYSEKGNTYQIYYENETSLGLKYDLVNESGIAGVAIWALGYDGHYPNLWNLLSEKFFNN